MGLIRGCFRGHVITGPQDLTTQGRCRQCTRTPVTAEEGVECLICGDILRTLTSGHIQRLHNLTPDEYHERFPGAPTVGTLYREIRRDMWDDRVTEGNPVQRPEREKGARQELCNRGLHEMTRGNSEWRGSGSRRRRQCRECKRESMRRWNATNAQARRDYMRDYYQANREERLVYEHERRPPRKRKPYVPAPIDPRACECCGESFTPKRRRTARFCSPACTAKAWREGCPT